MLLDINRALDRLQGAIELRQKPIPHRLDLAPPVRAKERANEPHLLVAEFEGLLLIRLRRGC
jgi:hypothetical protein